MKRFFQIVKKKKNKRRLSVVFLFLVTIELFCPVFCDKPSFAAESISPQPKSTVSMQQEAEARETSASANDDQHRNGEQTVCNDECLCHATAMPSAGITTPKRFYFRHEPVGFYFTDPVLSSLPPPDLPPKLS